VKRYTSVAVRNKILRIKRKKYKTISNSANIIRSFGTFLFSNSFF
jgi:hypothetical protein